jgi:hypothetical protein
MRRSNSRARLKLAANVKCFTEALQRQAATGLTTLPLLRRRVSSSGPCFGRLRALGGGLRGRSTPPMRANDLAGARAGLCKEVSLAVG